MSYYNKCPWCGAHLDPGEHCDCDKQYSQTDEEKEPDYEYQFGDVMKELVKV